MKARMLIFFLVIFVFCINKQQGLAEDFDWPRWRGPNGDGISMETEWDPKALKEGPKILWKTKVGMGHSNIAIKGKYIYTMGYKGREKGDHVYCLNIDTGEEIWRYLYTGKMGTYGTQTTPTIDGKFLYTLSADGQIFCFKLKNGKLLWKKDLVNDLKSLESNYGFATSPVVEGDLVILNAKTSGIALNKKTGDKIWEGEVNTDTEGNYFATPVIYDHDDKRYVLIFSGSGLFSIDVETGGMVWFYEWTQAGAPNVADPVVFDKKVFLSHSEANACCVLLDISGNEPSVLWENENLRNHVSTSVYFDGYLYGIDGDYFSNIKKCSLRCIDSKSGAIMWKEEMRGASLVAADGKLIILEDDGTLHIAEATPSSYQEISSCDVLDGEKNIRNFWTYPVLYKGKIYCRNLGGDLICIDVSK